MGKGLEKMPRGAEMGGKGMLGGGKRGGKSARGGKGV